MADLSNCTGELKEWAPLSDLLQKLPARAQCGIFSYEVKLTCVDVLPEFIALGTNLGIIYWYDRQKKEMQKLRCENSNSSITTVKAISTVDYMVACGNKNGTVNIFQVPKSPPDSLPDSLKPKNKQVERYTVSDLHMGCITTLEWSKNGMKLFSGDVNGHVVLTEIDFYMHLCKSVEILNDSYEVVQLSYCAQNLLVSTVFRTIICRKSDKWRVIQVGKKDRKTLGNFGGIFFKNSPKPSDVVVYCTRPGLRLWEADLQGSVQKTLLFKDILNKESPEVQLLNPVSINFKKLKPQKEASFGILLPFRSEWFVTYSNDVIYILNPKELTIISTVSNIRGILGIATNEDEIFILEEDRSLLRLSYKPENFTVSSPTLPTAHTYSPITSSLKELTNKIQTSSIIASISPFVENVISNSPNIHLDITSIIKAEEATESPIKHSNIPVIHEFESQSELQRKLEVLNQIGEEDFDDTILFKHTSRKKLQRSSNMTASILSLSSTSSDEKESNITIPTVMNLSVVGNMPDLKSLDAIQSEIEEKEKILSDVLNLDKVKIDLNSLDSCGKSSVEVRIGNKIEEVKEDLRGQNELEMNKNSYLKRTKTEIVNDSDYEKKDLEVNKHSENVISTNGLKTFVFNGINELKFESNKTPNRYQNKNFLEYNEQIVDIPEKINVPTDWNILEIKTETQTEVSEDWEFV